MHEVNLRIIEIIIIHYFLVKFKPPSNKKMSMNIHNVSSDKIKESKMSEGGEKIIPATWLYENT